MRKILLFIVLLLCSSFLRAQLDSFDLSTYKLPDITRHQLNFNIDLDGRSYSNDYYFRNHEDHYSKSNNFDGDLNLDYAFYKNSDKIQSNQLYRINFNSSFSDRKDEDGLSNESLNFGGSAYVNSVNRIYFNHNRFIGINLEFYFDRIKSDHNNFPFTQSYNSKDTRIAIPINAGFGRIEEIQDARLAIYILDELKKAGSLTRVPNEEEILEFAKLISKLKRERFFDSRKKKIYEIEQVDFFMQSKGIVIDTKSKYFTIVNDNWDYAALPYRSSGQRISYGVIPELNHKNEDNQYDNPFSVINDNNDSKKEYSLSANFNYSLEKPINLYWQSSFYFNLSGKYLEGCNESSSSISKVEIESPQLHSSIYYTLGYYPSTRTDMTLRLDLQFANSFGTEFVDNEKYSINYMNIYPNLQLRINYYISPQFKLNFRYYLYYSYIESDSEYYNRMYNDFTSGKNINQNISIGFVYQIF